MAAELLLTFAMQETLTRINEALDEIWEYAAGIGLVSTSLQHEDRAQEVCWDLDRETDSFLDSSEVVGREDDVSIVTEKLTSLTKQHVLSVVPIVGMPGLGKTTVAKKVCEVVREGKHFDVALWVCVSNDFNKVKILGAMLQMIDKTTGGLNNLDAILQNLKKELENKTFFLVLDDVWNEDSGKWDDLKEQLLKIRGKNGNAVVVTTRNEKIAGMMETSPGIQHQPGKLSDDECWSIIKQKVSGGGGATLTADFESIGKDIANKCGGLPLLAKVLGGTLRGKETQDWRSILDSRIWDTEDGNHMVEELGCLNELKGELDIYNLGQVRDKEEAGKAKLREKRMDKLVLEWSDEGWIRMLKEAMKWLYEASAEQCL
ncbi:hypothetical protein DKX38_020397 [Salix brachista]|uniref:Uncharacterized protein n=1 Tax=Salix brachista TaxID=2182728 RepID=A0A5N5KA74_9ROSI|nr:hypothetical protein DKX38_020397 [Salix brachista]